MPEPAIKNGDAPKSHTSRKTVNSIKIMKKLSLLVLLIALTGSVFAASNPVSSQPQQQKKTAAVPEAYNELQNLTGIVKSWNEKKGIGFIHTAVGNEIVALRSSLGACGGSLIVGRVVSVDYREVKGSRKAQAVRYTEDKSIN